jgi:hypothetical protein
MENEKSRKPGMSRTENEGTKENWKNEKHESNTENEKEEIIKDKSADHCVERKYPLTHVFDFFRVLSCLSWLKLYFSVFSVNSVVKNRILIYGGCV